MNRGYLKFSIESSQVSVSKDKKDVYITLSVSEGIQYKVSDVNVIGEMPIDEKIYSPIVNSQKGLNLLSSSNNSNRGVFC